MTDEEKIKDYDRLQYEYAQLHQKYRRLSERKTPTEANNNPETKQLIIGDVVGSNKLWLIEEDLVLCDNCGWVGDRKMLLPKTDLIIERDNKCPDCGSGEIEYFE